jgi:TonB family protein
MSRQDILYIVDGKEVDMYFINRIDPSDIESTTVLKEKTAVELYGEKGKNGVILITMKKPIDDKDVPKNAVYVVDGKVVTDISNLKDDDIRVMDIYTDGGVRKEHIAQYGEKAQNGVVFITLKTDEDRRKEWERLKIGTADEISTNPEVMPEFKGGQKELMEFLNKNVEYPKIAQENGVDGKVNIRFVVEKDGSVSNVEWLSTNLEHKKTPEAVKALQDEAMRVVKLTSGKWTAGQNNGKPVRCEFVLPIYFVLK